MYNNGFDYIALFPQTTVKSIRNNGIIKQGVIYITIPPSNETTQLVPVDIDSIYLNAPFYVEPIFNTDTDYISYQSISQIEVIQGNIKVTRIYAPISTEPIKLALYFAVNDVNVYKNTKIDITVPAFSGGLIQEIPYNFTNGQQLASFYVKCESTLDSEMKDYQNISQVEVVEGKVKITRLNEAKSEQIKISLNFEESGE